MGISVLMSIYQKEKTEYFQAAMESILAQTCPADEIVLIQDGPLTPELLDMIGKYQILLDDRRREQGLNRPRFVTYRFPENVKLGRALAKGVELCTNEYIARMDTDDIARTGRLEVQLHYMETHPQTAVLGGAIEEFNDEETERHIKHMPIGTGNVRTYGRYRNPVNHMTVMMRKSAILDAGNYVHFPNLEDYHLWIRVLAKGYQLDNLEEVLVEARTNEDFYGKRGGKGYWKRYMELRKMQHELGLTTLPQYLAACIATTVMAASPNQLRKRFYRILRR